MMGRMRVLDVLIEGFNEGVHPRGFHGRWIVTSHHPVHGLTTHPVDAASSKEAWSKGEKLGMGTVQSVRPFSGPPTPTKGAERAQGGQEAQQRLTQALTNLPQGRWHSVGSVSIHRTASGFAIHNAGEAKPSAVHRSPAQAAARALVGGRVRPMIESAPTVLDALLSERSVSQDKRGD